MYLRNLSIIISVSSVFFAAGCSVSEEADKQSPPKEKITTIPEDQVVSAPESEANTEPVTSDFGVTTELERVSEPFSLGKIKRYDLSPFFKGRTVLIAPSYIYQDQIVYFNQEEKSGHIYAYNTTRHDNQILYSTTNQIGMVTGLGAKILWLEMKQPTDSGTKWSIQQMDIATKVTTTLDSGESRFDTAPPHIEVTSDHATWITHEASKQKTISTLKSYTLHTGKVKSLQTFVLQEGQKREGIYPFDYRDSDGGLLLHKSTFKNGSKHPTLESMDDSYLRDMNGLIDFRKGKRFVALGTEGYAFFHHTGSAHDGLRFSSADSRLTVDAFRFLTDTEVIFREGMNQLYYADLNARTVAPLTDYEETTSKPVYANGKIAYAETDTNKTIFTVITPDFQ